MKTNKSFSKRLKVTGTGKLIARKSGFNHFNAKQSRTTQLQGRKGRSFRIDTKSKSHLLPKI